MITDAQATLLHAAELLEAEAKALNEFWNNKKNPPEWIGAPKARAIHDDALCTALELRLLARSIHDGKVAVPPAPTFADGMTAEDDRRFLELTNDLTHNAEVTGVPGFSGTSG